MHFQSIFSRQIPILDHKTTENSVQPLVEPLLCRHQAMLATLSHLLLIFQIPVWQRKDIHLFSSYNRH